MKRFTSRLAAATLCAAAFALAAPAAESPSVLLQKGIYAEETEGNLDSAIRIYEQIAAEAATNRAVVAQAQFRLAVCYQKQGKKEQAVRLLNEVLQQFPTEAGLGTKAREALKAMGVAPAEAVSVRRLPLPGNPGWIVAVSSDGRLAAYQPWDSNELFVCDLGSGDTRRIATDAEIGGHSPPAFFSPDGTWITYDDREAGVRVAKTDGTEVKKLFSETAKERNGVWIEMAGWSADGTEAIMAQWDNVRSCRVAVGLDIRTGAAREIAAAPHYRSPDQWKLSTDCKFVARQGGDYPKSITLLDFKSGAEETVLDRDAGPLIGWTFADTQLVYSKNGPRGIEVWAVDVKDGKNVGVPRLVLSDAVNEFSRGARRSYPLGVSRDGRIFYTVEREKPAVSELWVMEGFLSDKPSAKAPALNQTEIPPDELVVGPDRSLVDRKFGLSTVLPTGWKIASALRIGEGGTVIRLSPNGDKNSSLIVGYFRTTPWIEGPIDFGPGARVFGPKKPAPSEVDGWLRETAERLAHWAQELKDYKRDPAGSVSRVVGGCKALTWNSTYTRKDEKWVEFAVQVYSENAHGHITLRTPEANIASTRPAFEKIVESFRLPKPVSDQL